MASIISAGTTSNTALNLSGDTSGVLQLATNGSTTAITIDTSQNVGIGTSSPQGKLDVSSSSAGVTAGDLVVDTANKTVYVGRQSSTGGDNSYLIVRGRLNGSGTNQAIVITGDTTAYGTGIFRPNNDNIGFSTLATERMRITSAGYSKFTNSGSYVSSSGSYHEFTNDNPATESLIVRNTSTSQTSTSLEVRGARNTTNNTFYAIDYYNTAATAYRFRVADSGAIATVGGIALGTATPATSGIGVQFPATQSASSDANTLDDYEEGTWTTSVTASSNITGTPSLSEARYIKIGQLVTIEGYFSAQVTSSSLATYWTFTLPFVTAANSSGACGTSKQESNYIIGGVSDATSGSNNVAYISYSQSAALPSGTATHSFSYTYISST